MVEFQTDQEFASTGTISTYVFGFLLGFGAFILLSIFYFFPTTREKGQRLPPEQMSDNPIKSVTQYKSSERWYNYFRTENERTYYYLGRHFKIYQSRTTKHLDQSIIENVFAQNRINASIFEVITIVAFIISGQFIDYSVFEFPAAMSAVLLLTILHMIFSALMSWFHRWTYPIIFGSIFLMNYLSLNTPFFNYTNFAYGLNYGEENIRKYNIREIQRHYLDDESNQKSRKNIDRILQNWKTKTGKGKPKLIILTTSGGGSRSALWTFTVLQNCDKVLNGSVTNHLNLITGASGGMVGAAYYRELVLRKYKGEIKDIDAPQYALQLGMDLLNKLSFSASTKDLFYRFQHFTYNKESYPVDRGYAFEEQLHENTNRVMEHSLGYYASYEKNANIPLMLFTPTIVNDGRRLYISSQSMQFMIETQPSNPEINTSFENIDYQTFFKDNHPEKLRFSSALRTSATFPFIMPMVTLPTSPEMQLMDAGIRDNYGMRAALNYLFANEEWIKENTSGVILLSIRDTKKILKNEFYHHISLTDKLTLPFGNMYNNFPRTQDFDQDELFKLGVQGFDFPVNMVIFNLRESKKDRISLSWHLTAYEKLKIKKALYSPSNIKASKQLEMLLK